MNLRIRDRLVFLITVPLTMLALFIATAAWIHIETRAATVTQDHWNRSLLAYSKLSETLGDAQTGMRGYVITGNTRFKKPYYDAAADLEPELARLTNLARADRAERANASSLSALARTSFAFDVATVALVDRGQREAARHAVASGKGLIALDRFRSAVAVLENDAIRRRELSSVRLDTLWLRTFTLIEIAALAAIAVTIALYLMVTRRIAERLRRVGEDAVRISRGIAPVSPPSGNDDIAQLGRSLHTIIALARSREEELRKYKLLADQAQHIIFWVGPDDRLVEVNQAASNAYGYDRAELLAMAVGDLRAPDDREGVPAVLKQARSGGSAHYETLHRRKNGEIFPIEVSLNTTIIDGQEMLLAIVRDISERKRVEAVTEAFHNATEASLKLKSEFVTTMSHEIRTPMNAVIGMTELLLDSELTSEQLQHSAIIRDASFALLGIIDNILDFSKIEAGQVQLERRETSIVDLVESAATMLGDNAHRKGISLMTYVDERVPATVMSDQMRIRQVLINLIGNAVKFTETGAVVVSVTFAGESAGASLVRFAVKDSGIGFDAITARKIFEPFQQADGSTTRKYGGTGLGLTICRQLVDLLGGELVVESTAGIGSDFAFTLRLEHGPVAVVPHLSSIAGKRALIVDNDETARRILRTYLGRWDVDCDVAENAAGALEALRECARSGRPCDFAIVDYAMPDCNGLELGERIKADPLIAGTALMMVTAFDASRRGQAAIAAGFVRYLTKPVRQAHLHDCIVEAISHAPPHPAERRKLERDAPPGIVASRAERILIVEDEPVNQLLAKRQLGKLGFAAHGVNNGEQAVNAIAFEQYDLVLMDCQMPVMDGLAATRAIRFSEAKTGRRVPIIAMTANARPDDRDACIAAGMDDYLAKPVQIEHLRAMLATWLAETSLVAR